MGLLLAGGMVLLGAGRAQAFEEVGPPPRVFSYIEDRFSINLGVMHTYLNTQVQVNRNNLLPGTFFDVESDLGLEGDQIRFFGDAMYRIGKHASFRATYLDLARSHRKTISKDIRFGDTVFAANSTVTASITSKNYLVNYQYSFVRNARQEFGLTAGFNIADISTSLRLDADVTGPVTTREGSRSREANFLAPVPLVGIFLSSQILARTFFRNSIQYMDIDAGGYSFKALNYIVGIDYNPMPNFGVGAGVYANRIQVDKGGNVNGRFLNQVTGTQFYLRYFY
jgi:hypothetical protein